MKHGPSPCSIDPAVCVATYSPTLDKVLSNMAEAPPAALTIAIATEGRSGSR
jgi:hypothetical protein